jgi:glycosyltransferase involved in cell wall biosynthesis
VSNKLLKIFGLPVDDGGCGWYRIRQPFHMIREHTKHDTHIWDRNKDDSIEVAKALGLADVLVGRPGSELGAKRIMEDYSEYKHLKYVLDIDDNTEIISPYNFHYKDYGVCEYYDKNAGKWIWQNGKYGFDTNANKKRLSDLKWGLKNADLVTVTTEKLAKYVKKYNENVAILDNHVNMKVWWPLPREETSEIRVGWAGGMSHYEDWYSIRKPLVRLMKKYKFKLVLIGQSFPGLIPKNLRHLIINNPWVPFKGHSYRTMCMQLDVALIPLANLPFNHYKSAIKFYEMSAMAVPSVVSNILPYSNEIQDNVTAYAYSSEKEFEEKLEQLIMDKKERKRIGNNAYEWVKEYKDANKYAHLWIDAYRKII